MAKNTIVHIVDDIDGTKNAQSVSFSYQGTDYTIDLGKKNLTAFEKALAPYIEAATKVPKSRKNAKRATGSPQRDLAAVRDWARSAGIELSSRGRIPTHVMEQYEAAQS